MKTIKTGKLFRSISLSRDAVNKEARTIELSFSSESPVERWFGTEVLDHAASSIRLGRLNDGGPLLLDHETRQQIGVVEQAVIGADRKSRAVVRFGKSPLAEEVFQDVLDGIRRNVSVGYQIHRMVLEEEKQGSCAYRAMDWEPLEISIVPIPADSSVGIGRSEGAEKQYLVKVFGKNEDIDSESNNMNMGGRSMEKEEMKKEKEAPVVDITKVRKETLDTERARVREMNAIADKHPEFRLLVGEFVSSDKPIDELRAAILEKMGAKKIPTDTMAPNLGMSDKEVRQYSIVRAIRQMSNHEPLDGLEREASDAVAKMTKREAKGFFIPNDITRAKRALSAGAAASGGYTVDSDVMGSSMIELLRNKAIVAQLGAKTLSGLNGNVLIPRHTGGATAYWLPESGTVTASDQSFGQLALTPHRLVGDTAFSKELLVQASIDVEGFVREDLMRILAIEKDRAAINGLGAAGEPTGILNTTGIGTVTFGAAATWAKAIDFETQIANANADVGQMAFLSTPAVRGKWKGIAKASNYPVYLWETGANGSGLVNGYKAEATKQVPSDKVIFGNWNDLIMAEWAGIDVVVDPYSLKKSGQIEVTITLWCDLGVRHAGSFCVSTDSGAQ